MQPQQSSLIQFLQLSAHLPVQWLHIVSSRMLRPLCSLQKKNLHLGQNDSGLHHSKQSSWFRLNCRKHTTNQAGLWRGRSLSQEGTYNYVQVCLLRSLHTRCFHSFCVRTSKPSGAFHPISRFISHFFSITGCPLSRAFPLFLQHFDSSQGLVCVMDGKSLSWSRLLHQFTWVVSLSYKPTPTPSEWL